MDTHFDSIHVTFLRAPGWQQIYIIFHSGEKNTGYLFLPIIDFLQTFTYFLKVK